MTHPVQPSTPSTPVDPQHDVPPPDRPDAPGGLGIDWVKTAAGALAAVTTAVLLSTLGAAGTLLGAAIGSVAATVGSALYAQGLAKSKQTVLKAQETALVNLGVSATAVHRARDRVAQHDEDVAALHEAETSDGAPQHSTAPATPGRLVALPWKRLALLAAGTFLVVMVAITGFETLTGRSVSGYTGGSSAHQGSTLGGVTGTGSRGSDHDGGGTPSTPTASPTALASSTAAASGSATPTATGSVSAETSTPSASTDATPTTTPTPTASSTPSVAPTSRPSGSASATP